MMPDGFSFDQASMPIDTEVHGNALDPATTGRAMAVYQGLVNRGMDSDAALGYAANAVQESRADPGTKAGDAGASHGTFMWNGDRLATYRAIHGHNPEDGDLDEHLDHVMWENNGPEAANYQKVLLTPGGAPAKAAAISTYWERPKDTVPEENRRSWIARQLAPSAEAAETKRSAAGFSFEDAATPLVASFSFEDARAPAVAEEQQQSRYGSDLPVAQKDEGAYPGTTIGKGVKEPPDLTDKYNTQLSTPDEAKFQDWVQSTGKQNDLFDYDLRGAWKANAQAAANGHLPDTWKKPNHPTFSDQSQYNGADGNVGGQWVQPAKEGQPWGFHPGPANLANHGLEGVQQEIARDPSARVLDPLSTNVDNTMPFATEGGGTYAAMEPETKAAPTWKWGLPGHENEPMTVNPAAQNQTPTAPSQSDRVTAVDEFGNPMNGPSLPSGEVPPLPSRNQGNGQAYKETSYDYQFAPPRYTPEQLSSGLVYPDLQGQGQGQDTGLTNLQDPRAQASVRTVVPGQGVTGAALNKFRQETEAALGSTAAAIPRVAQGIGILLRSNQMGAISKIDAGADVPQDQDAAGYQFMSPVQKATFKAQLAATATDAGADTTREKAERVAPVSTALESSPAVKFAGMAGGMAPIALGAAFGGLPGADGAAFLQSYEGMFQRARTGGASLEDAHRAAMTSGLANAALMTIPAQQLFGRLVPGLQIPVLGSVLDAAVAGGSMVGVNQVQALTDNAVAKYNFDPNQSLTEGVGDPGDMALQGLLGVAFHTLPSAPGAVARMGNTVVDTVGNAWSKSGRYAPAFSDYLANGPGDSDAQTAGRQERESREAWQADMANRGQPGQRLLAGPDVTVTNDQGASAGADSGTNGPGRPASRRPMTPEAAAEEEAVTPSTPEPPGDIEAQIAAMTDPANPKDAVFVAAGNEGALPAKLPKGTMAARDDSGTLLTTNPEKLRAFNEGPVNDALLARLLGYPETKDEAIASGQPVVVQGKDGSGNVVSATLASPEGVPASREAVAAQTPADGRVEVVSPTQAQQERASEPTSTSRITPFTTVPKEPTRLTDFLRQDYTTGQSGTVHQQTVHGGLRDTGGDLAAILGATSNHPALRGGRGFRGLINNETGSTLDDATQRAWDAGYFPEHDERPSTNDLLDKLDEDVNRGNPQYSHYDQDAVDAYRYAIGHNNDIDRLSTQHGIPTHGVTRAQFLDVLADHVSLEEAAREHDEATAAHQDAYNQWTTALRGLGSDPEDYAPRSLEEMEDEHRQADASEAAGAVSSGGERHAPAGGNPGDGESGAGQGGRGVGNSGRAGTEGGFTGLTDHAAAYRDELPGGLEAGRVPLFSPVERAVSALRQPRGTGEQMLAQITKTPGVKPDEIKWMGLDDWLKGRQSVTRDQIADFVRANQLDVREVTRGGTDPERAQVQREVEALGLNFPDASMKRIEDAGGSPDLVDRFSRYVIGDARNPPTRYGGYALPGGQNYRELLITLPAKKPIVESRNIEGFGHRFAVVTATGGDILGHFPSRLDAEDSLVHNYGPNDPDRHDTYHGPHWDEPNVLAHVRFDERTAPDGKRVLMVHEVQSDWGQTGRKSGYRPSEPEVQKLHNRANELTTKGHAATSSEKQEWADIQNRLQANGNAVPNMPFKTTWPALVMKRMIKYAVDNGFDRVAWSPGEVHAERYDLSKHINRLDYVPSENTIWAYDKNDRIAHTIRDVTPENMADKIGKEAAEKLLAQPDREPVAGPIHAGRMWKRLEGADLKVGGEGMKAFYDKMLPNEVRKIVGKFGGKVGLSEISEATPFATRFGSDGRVYTDLPDGTRLGPFDTIPQARAAAKRAGGKSSTVHSVDITPVMRAAIQTQGIGLFAGRRLPVPPSTGPDLFNAPRAQPAPRAPEPTIRTDQRQATLAGTEPSARQAQAARDAAGPRGGQLAPNEGLFGNPETVQPELPAPRASRWLNTEPFHDLLYQAPATGHEAATNWVSDRGHDTGHEYVAVVDNRTGHLIHAGTSGLENEVKWKGENGADLPRGSLTIHHNHPNGSALSGADIGMLANPAVSHVVAHGADGTTTIASLTPAWTAKEITAAAMSKAYRELNNARFYGRRIARSILQDLVNKDLIEPRHADLAYEDVANRLLAAHGAITYSSTRELAQPIKDALAPVFRKLGHADAADHDRYTVAVRAQERIASLPAPSVEPARQRSAGNSGRDQGSSVVSQSGKTGPGSGGGRLIEGEALPLTTDLRSGEALTPEQRSTLARNRRNGPIPPREMPNLVDQGPPRPAKQFQTAKGSIYQVHEDGTTTRNKAYRPEHGEAEQGIQPRSAKTVYVDPEQLKRLAPPMGGWRIMAEPDGTYSLMTSNGTPVGWGYNPSSRNVPVESEPRVGLLPMELWKPETIAGRTMYRGMHPGNAITSVSHAQPRMSPSVENEAELPLSGAPQPGMGHNGPPPSDLWPPNEQPPEPPKRPPEIEAARLTRPQAIKNLNPVEKLTIFPRILASLDEASARLWNAWQARSRDETTNVDQLRKVITPNFLKLDKPSRLKVAGALEIARIEGEENLIANPDGTLDAHNVAIPFARWSKVGTTLRLNAQEAAAYREAVQLGKDQWTMLMKGAARRYGWGGDIDPDVIRAAAKERGEPGDYHKLDRLADLLDVMKQHEQDVYFPIQRFGSYFIAIRPKEGPDVVANLGGHPPTAWFETIEKPAFQDLLGVTKGRLSVQAIAAKRITELQKQFPPDKFDYRQGDFIKTLNLLRQINIPAVEKLFMLMENRVKASVQEQVMRGDNPPTTKHGVREEAKNRYEVLHGSTLEAFYDALFEELKSGYRRRAKVVPGYSDDFDRSIASHLYQIARNAADMVHRDGIESAYQNIQDFHPHDTVKRYWKDWHAYQEDPGSTLSRAAETMNQIGFTYMLGMNPSSTIIIAAHMPMTAAPVLSVGVGPSVAVPALTRGLGRAYAALRFDTKHGGHIDLDKAMAGMPPAKQAFLRLMAKEGRLAAVGTHDMAALNDRMSGLFGGYADTARRGMEIATSNVHAVDQANRFAVAAAAFDIASNPKTFNAAAAPLMRHNAIFRDMVQRESLSPETYGRFMLSKAAFDWGKQNQPPIMRGPLGRLMFALHGFQTRYLSAALELAKNSGPEGRWAWGLMMAALGLGAGALGLPGTEDALNAADAVWHHFTGRDPALKFKLHDAIQNAGFGQMGADMILRGPLSVALGVNLGSRIGFGDVLSREFESSNALGTIPSIMWSAYEGSSQRAASGQVPAATAAEAAPGALRGPLRAYAATEQGILSRKGVPQIPTDQLSETDVARLASGFQPMSVAHRQEETERYVKAQHSQDAWASMIKTGGMEDANKEMIEAGWGLARRRAFIKETLQPSAIGKQFMRFEQQRGAAPP